MTTVPSLFVQCSAAYLREDLLPRIRHAVETLPEADLWWRPNEASNSIGNLVLHLAGNVRQWIVAGVGGAADVRQRQEEFDAREGLSRAELLAHLGRAVGDAVAVLDRLSPERLVEPLAIQGNATTVLGAIYHVVEHFSMHTGQILLLAKARTGRDLGLYRVRDGNATPAWKQRG